MKYLVFYEETKTKKIVNEKKIDRVCCNIPFSKFCVGFFDFGLRSFGPIFKFSFDFDISDDGLDCADENIKNRSKK